jgi:hypothetical protein
VYVERNGEEEWEHMPLTLEDVLHPRYEEADDAGRVWLEPVGMALGPLDDWIAWYDGEGRAIEDYTEMAEARAEAARARAEAEARLREMEAELRRLRGEREP